MRTFYLLVMAVLFATPASAEEPPVLPDDVCRMMVEYQPDPANDAEYKPGVDVHGRPVVEADIDPSPASAPETVSIAVTADIAKYTGLEIPDNVEAEAVIGTITVEKGKISFNGQPLEGPSAQALRELCVKKPPLQKEPGTIYNQ